MQKIVTFGEIMLRLATPGYKRFIQSGSLSATFGGGGSKRGSFTCKLWYSSGVCNPVAGKRDS